MSHWLFFYCNYSSYNFRYTKLYCNVFIILLIFSFLYIPTLTDYNFLLQSCFWSLRWGAIRNFLSTYYSSVYYIELLIGRFQDLYETIFLRIVSSNYLQKIKAQVSNTTLTLLPWSVYHVTQIKLYQTSWHNPINPLLMPYCIN